MAPPHKAALETAIGSHLFGWRRPAEREFLPAPDPELRLPRGAISEIAGPVSSGRTRRALLVAAGAAAAGELCAWVDACDMLDPVSAAALGVPLERLLWVRCRGHLEHALKAAGFLVEAGGFGLVVLDLAGLPPAQLQRLPLSVWHRLRRAVENTPTALLILEIS